MLQSKQRLTNVYKISNQAVTWQLDIWPPAFKIIGLLDYLIMGQQQLLHKVWVAQNYTETIPT